MNKTDLIKFLENVPENTKVLVQQPITENNKFCPPTYKEVTSIDFNKVKNQIIITFSDNNLSESEVVERKKPAGELFPSKRNEFDLEGWSKFRLDE
jgi:hypothetical protein